MRVAFPTNDKVSLFKRSGRAKGFLIVDILEDRFNIIDFRANTHTHDHYHGEEEHHDHTHKEIVDALNDCQVIVVNMIGKHFDRDLQRAGIKIFKTGKQDIIAAVEDFKNN